MKNIFALLTALLVGFFPLRAQNNTDTLLPPFDFELTLSGNFGELRSNHYHSGVDFKTQGVTGKPIRCVADGYISRASVQPGGYGLALYIIHDNGYMTVYGHLDRFPAAIDSIVRNTQYKNESYSTDVSFEPNRHRVKKGETIAHAGNSGYSFGPHLHFEVRDTTGNELYDPMTFYAHKLKDKRPPIASKIAIYTFPGKGAIDTQEKSKTYNINNNTVDDSIKVWGKIGIGIKALDYMDGTNNKYGVYKLELLVDDSLRFTSTLNKFSFTENRLINAWIDYPRHINDNEWFQRMFILPNNPMRALNADSNRGWIEIDEERPYKIECRLTDYHGNSNSYIFNLQGKAQEIPHATGTHQLHWFLNNRIEYESMLLDIPRGELFEDTQLNITQEAGKFGFSSRYTIGDDPQPLWHSATLAIKPDTLPRDPAKLYIKRITKKGGYSVGGNYHDGWISTTVNSLGSFEVAIDSTPPRLQPINEKTWAKSRKAIFVANDKETSIKSFRGTVDGKFALFSYSSKNSRIILDLKKENISKGKHLIKLEITDACGNSTTYEKSINFK